jgi:hypothetical protein
MNQTSATPTYGYASGPGILESWFNQRANGTDPGYEYSLNRGISDINNQYAARGGYNSSAATGAIRDFTANMGAQRESQLDALAGGASNEYQNRLNSMFSQAGALAGGQANTAAGYDTSGLNANTAYNMAALQAGLSKAGIPLAQAQSTIGLLTGGGKLLTGMFGGGAPAGGGGGYATGDGLMSPTSF